MLASLRSTLSVDLPQRVLAAYPAKALLCSAKARTRAALDQALTQIINECIFGEDALGWFAHWGLFI
ncbi:MAG: hypothetical protein F6K28_31350 [Microcoleus sp. SIO2G3]|nr:hypothetical protein [Microcoleus sp. SIO2G3]